MNTTRKRIALYLRSIPHLYRYGLLTLMVLFISLFFPNNIRVEYQFEQGDTWKYDDMRAPFSFPIKKTNNEVESERRIMSREFLPYYRLDKNIGQRQKELFIEMLSKQISIISKDTLGYKAVIDSTKLANIGINLLDRLYKQHIIKVEPQHERKNNSIAFKLIDNQIETGEFTSKDFVNVKKATQIAVDSLEPYRDRIPQSSVVLNIIAELVQEPDIVYDAELTKKNKDLALKNLSPVRGMVKAGELIIRRGEIIDSTAYVKLVSYSEKYEQEVNKHKNSSLIYLGYISLTIALLLTFSFFIKVYNPTAFDNIQHFTLVFILIAVFLYISFTIDKLALISLYFIPYCIVPIIVKNFFSPQLALFTHLVIVLLASLVLSLDYNFIVIQTIAGMMAVISKRKIRYMTDFFVSVFYIGLAYTLCYISSEFLHKGVIYPVIAYDGRIVEQGVYWGNLGWIGLNVLLTLLSYPFIPLLERGFGLTSEITLIELSDLNKPLLRELSFKAPGTMQHSLQVANLAEAAATEIGANALLVKVGALYHDVGKMLNPQYFIENQHPGNPHLELNYQESAKMIISHVTEGVKLAKKHGLPTVIIDFISTHHGTTRVEYFYRMYKNENPDKPISESDFTYPGPRPRNKEEVILMLADSTEAASKSLKNPTGKDIDNLVENIVSFKLSHGQLQDSDLTFAELDAIKAVFKKLLRSIYHVRIEYPEEKISQQTAPGSNL